MASREQNRRGNRRDTVNQDDELAGRLISDQERLLFDDDQPADGPFARFAATSDRFARLDQERAERFTARAAEELENQRAVILTHRTTAAAPSLPEPPAAVPVSELTRLTDRLVEAREQLATAQEQIHSHQLIAAIASNEVTAARAEVQELQDRLIAARAIVHEAQRTARQATERTAFVEGRADALEAALDRALHASFWERRKWRRSRQG